MAQYPRRPLPQPLQPINALPVDTDPNGGLHGGGLTTGTSPSTARLALNRVPVPAVATPVFPTRPVMLAGDPASASSALRQAASFPQVPVTSAPATAAPVPAFPDAYRSGSNYNTAQARADYNAGRINVNQLLSVYDAAQGVGNAQATHPMSATDAANAAAERAHPSSPGVSYGLIHEEAAPFDEQPAYVRNSPGTTIVPNGTSQPGTVTVGGGPAPVLVGSAPGAAPSAPRIAPSPTGLVAATGAPSGNATGISVNGVPQIKQTDGSFVAGSGGAAPLTYGQQKQAILDRYPQVGVAGSPQNQAFLAAVKAKGFDLSPEGQNGVDVLGLARSLFSHTQAQVVAADKQQASAQSQRQVQADLANRTPDQIAAESAKEASNQALETAAGKTVYDPDATAANLGKTIADAAGTASVANVGDYWADKLSPMTNFVKGVFSGDPTSVPATPVAPKIPAAAPAATPGINTQQPAVVGSAAPAAVPPMPKIPDFSAPSFSAPKPLTLGNTSGAPTPPWPSLPPETDDQKAATRLAVSGQ